MGGFGTAPSPTAWRKLAATCSPSRGCPSQWKSARTTNAIERLHKEFKRRIKTQSILPSPESAATLFWALLASGQIPSQRPAPIRRLRSLPDPITECRPELRDAFHVT